MSLFSFIPEDSWFRAFKGAMIHLAQCPCRVTFFRTAFHSMDTSSIISQANRGDRKQTEGRGTVRLREESASMMAETKTSTANRRLRY